MKLSSGEDFGKIVKEATPEEQKYLMLARKKGGTPEEQPAMQNVSAGTIRVWAVLVDLNGRVGPASVDREQLA